jgi:hypothetical protein
LFLDSQRAFDNTLFDDRKAEFKMSSITESLQAEIFHEDAKFQRACSQVVLLNTCVQDLQTRYDRAVKDNLRNYRYTLRLRLCTVEGIRNMYYEYATSTADKIEALENRMRELGVEPAIIYTDAVPPREPAPEPMEG